jgi:hypothetical protein
MEELVGKLLDRVLAGIQEETVRPCIGEQGCRRTCWSGDAGARVQAAYDALGAVLAYVSDTIAAVPPGSGAVGVDAWRQCAALDDADAGLQALLALVTDWPVKVHPCPSSAYAHQHTTLTRRMLCRSSLGRLFVTL